MYSSIGTSIAAGIRSDDVIYSYLPCYHASGVQVGIGPALCFGNRTVLKKKFSASNFFSDCVKYDVTATQYIGEIARFLLATPPSEYDKSHKVRIMFGNGLKPQIWTQFVERFNIKDIGEFYAATESNTTTINVENQVGAVGFLAVCWPDWLTSKFVPLYVVRVDKETGEPVRDESGHCILAEPGEPGELLGKIVRCDPIKDFNGYKDRKATEKKILNNVFEKGDLYFRSGDILVKDEFGYLYFKDRTGDTFRWRGENVSTNEVEATVSNILDQRDATAFGVEVPHNDGRAGMVAIPATGTADDGGEIDLDKLVLGVMKELPAYARPLFVRLVTRRLDLTGTYKLKKTELQSEGFDLTKVKDPIYFLNSKLKKYVRMDSDLYRNILSGEVKV